VGFLKLFSKLPLTVQIIDIILVLGETGNYCRAERLYRMAWDRMLALAVVGKEHPACSQAVVE